MGSGFKSRKTIKRSSQSLGNRPLESNCVMTFYNGVLSRYVDVNSGGSRISPRRGRQLPRGAPTYEFVEFSQKLHEIERIWTPLRSATGKFVMNSSNLTNSHNLKQENLDCLSMNHNKSHGKGAPQKQTNLYCNNNITLNELQKLQSKQTRPNRVDKRRITSPSLSLSEVSSQNLNFKWRCIFGIGLPGVGGRGGRVDGLPSVCSTFSFVSLLYLLVLLKLVRVCVKSKQGIY